MRSAGNGIPIPSRKPTDWLACECITTASAFPPSLQTQTKDYLSIQLLDSHSSSTFRLLSLFLFSQKKSHHLSRGNRL